MPQHIAGITKSSSDPVTLELGDCRKVVARHSALKMSEKEIEIPLKQGHERFPHARPRIRSDNGLPLINPQTPHKEDRAGMVKRC